MSQAHVQRIDPGFGALRRLWLRIHEPRVVAIIHFFTYAVLMGGGIVALWDPPTSIAGQIGLISMLMLAGMLTIGGAIGAVAVLPGWWWVERYATMLVVTAATIYAIIIGTLQVTSTGNRLLQLSVVLGLIGHVIVRMVRIWERPYDPARRNR